MGTINAGRLGLVLALLVGGWHALWSLFVGAGLAQPLIDFIFWMHFIKPVFMLEAFDFGRAALLVAVTAGLGFAMGYILALLWNAVRE